MTLEDKQSQSVTVYCGVCGAMFSSWEDYDTHYKHEHLKDYGPNAFGVHPRIEVYDSSISTKIEEKRV